MVTPMTSRSDMNIPQKPLEIKKYFSIGLFLTILFASGWFTDFSLPEVFRGIGETREILSKMFLHTDLGYVKNLLGPLAETIQMSLIGTAIGAVTAVPVAVFSARNFIKHKLFTGFWRNFLGVFRTIPALVFAAIFASVFGLNSFSGMLALSVFTFGLLAKLIYEAMEGIDHGAVEALEASGASQLSILRYAFLPQILPQYLSFILYAFEINIRSASILGYVGAGGIGVFYQRNLSFFRYERIGTIVILTFVVVLITDAVSAKIREKLV